MTFRQPFYPLLITGNESGGEIVASSDPVPRGYTLEIERIVISTNSSTNTEARVFRDRVSDFNLESGSTEGNFDEGEFRPPIRLAAGERLVIRWTNAPSAGSQGRARIQAVLVREEGTAEGRAPIAPRRAIAGGW